MNENKVAKTLRIIGIVEFVSGIIVALYCLFEGDPNWYVAPIVGFITGMMFVGFAEIITLLYEMSYKQDRIINHLTAIPKPQKSILEDIESHLPKI